MHNLVNMSNGLLNYVLQRITQNYIKIIDIYSVLSDYTSFFYYFIYEYVKIINRCAIRHSDMMDINEGIKCPKT